MIFLAPSDTTLQTIFFDGTSAEHHVLDGTLTDNPIEDGSVVSDHFIKSPIEFSCEVVVTATPGRPDWIIQGEGSVAPVQLVYAPLNPPGILIPSPSRPLPQSINALQFVGVPDRIKRAWSQLSQLYDGAILCSVGTTRRQYDDMQLTHIEEDMTKIYIAHLKLHFRQVRTVQTQQVTASQPKEPRGVPPTNQGNQNPLDDASNTATSWFKQFQGDKSVLLGLAQQAGIAQ